MNDSIETDSRSPPRSTGTVTRATAGDEHHTAQPALTSGFGAVIEKEQELQAATEDSLGQLRGPRSADLDRILHHHHLRLGANIALLEQRYEGLPKPDRFVNWHDRRRPPAEARRTQRDEAQLLPALVAMHTRLLTDIDALIGCAPDGQRGEFILSEVARNHEEMAWMLTALLKEDESAKGMASVRTSDRAAETIRAQENWDNEGGPVRVDPPAV